jgi:hypothetical protein
LPEGNAWLGNRFVLQSVANFFVQLKEVAACELIAWKEQTAGAQADP